MTITLPELAIKNITMLQGMLPNQSPRLLDQMRDKRQVKLYSIRIE